MRHNTDSYKPFQKIEVNETNSFFSHDTANVLFNKEKTKLIRYGVSDPRTTYTIPTSVTEIIEGAFGYAKKLTKIEFT